MTEAEIQRKTDLLEKAFDRREILVHMGALDEMIDNQLRLLYNQLSSDRPRQIRFLLRQGITPAEIIAEGERTRDFLIGFHKRYAPGDIVSDKYNYETAQRGEVKEKKKKRRRK